MLSYNEIKQKIYIELEGEPYEVLSSDVFRKQKRKPVNQTKLKNLISGRVLERSFHSSETAKEAELETKLLKYLYKKNDDVWLSSLEDPKDRFSIPYSLIEPQLSYIKEGDSIQAILFNEKIISFKLPIKLSLLVKEAPPGTKGNTASGGNKVVILETGLKITTPLFIKAGDIIEINTQKGEYIGRVN